MRDKIPHFILRIEAFNAVDIKGFQTMSAEYRIDNELLLLPGTLLDVVGIVEHAGDVVEIQLREAMAPKAVV